MPGPSDITHLLSDWSNGDQAALDQLLPVVYDELHRLASNYMRRERPDHTLQTTALVHEAYLRLVDQDNAPGHTRAQFFAAAAQVMRHILIDHARGHRRGERGGGIAGVALGDAAGVSGGGSGELLAGTWGLIQPARFRFRVNPGF